MNQVPADDLLPIVVGLARRDPSALVKFYDLTCARVFGLIVAVVADAAMAEALVQRVYLQVWSCPEDYRRADGSVLAWLLALAHGLATDAARATGTPSSKATSWLQGCYYGALTYTELASRSGAEPTRVLESIRAEVGDLGEASRSPARPGYAGRCRPLPR